jgi:hypothetical protein
MSHTLPIPGTLIREEISGKVFPYKGYRKILSGEVTPLSAMGSSELQSTLVSIIHGYLFGQLDRKQFHLVTGEPGIHLTHGDNLANDIAIYARSESSDALTTNYFSRPPVAVIEVDVKVDTTEAGMSEFEYVILKSQQLIGFGCRQVVWVLTSIRQLVVFTGEASFQVLPWSAPLSLPVGAVLHLEQWITDEGFHFE